jgi:hypothetical protein
MNDGSCNHVWKIFYDMFFININIDAMCTLQCRILLALSEANQ